MILLISLLAAIVFTLFTAATSMGIGDMLDIVSLLIILIPMVFFLIITKDGKVLISYIKTSFKKNPQYSAAELRQIAAAAKNTRKVITTAGLFGLVMGLCALFANIGDENLAIILMRNLSVAVLTVIYSFVFGFFTFFPLQVWAEKKLADS